MTLLLDALTVTLHGLRLVSLSASVLPGRPLTIMGPSGSGKSTALAAMAGTLDAAFQMSGRIVLNGRDISSLPTRLRRVGLMFQDDILFPHLSVGQNLGFGLPAGLPRDERRARIGQALADLDLAGFETRDPATLSGGQRARVALMRTLLSQPQALLLDEPFSRLDAALRQQIRTLTFETCRALPIILVTHDAEDARSAGGMVLSPMGDPIEV
jgi:putative thiamine transport system ATP-binding protein